MPNLDLLRRSTILPWMLAGLLIGSFAALLIILAGIFTRARNQAETLPTPALTIIAAPSATTTPNPSVTPDFPLFTPTPTPVPPSPGEIAPGQLVEIFGTGGDNLRLRSQPGLDSAIAFLGVESEVFEVLDGPEQLDGYSWWYLRNPYNEDKTGWAVSVYLRQIASP